MRFVRLPRSRGAPGRASAWRVMGPLLTVAALSGAAGCAEAVANSAGIFVQVSPATVAAGAQTQVTASCGENVNAATVSSTAFGSETIQPNNGVLMTTVTVAPNTAPGTYGVRLACPTGSQATTTLTIISSGASASSAPGPNTGGGFLAENPDTTEVAAQPADRTPLVWLGVGLSSLLAASAVAVRSKQRATVRSRRRPGQRDQGNPGPR